MRQMRLPLRRLRAFRKGPSGDADEQRGAGEVVAGAGAAAAVEAKHCEGAALDGGVDAEASLR